MLLKCGVCGTESDPTSANSTWGLVAAAEFSIKESRGKSDVLVDYTAFKYVCLKCGMEKIDLSSLDKTQ